MSYPYTWYTPYKWTCVAFFNSKLGGLVLLFFIRYVHVIIQTCFILNDTTMESRCAMTIVFCLFIFGNSFCLIAFVNCFLLIAFWCLLFVNWFMLFVHFIFYFLSAAFSTIWLVCFNGHRNFAMRNYISIDSICKIPYYGKLNGNAYCQLFLLIAYCLLLNDLCLFQIAFC